MMPHVTKCFALATVFAAGLLSAQPAKSPYGICAHLARGSEFPIHAQELALMKAAGIEWARTDVDWSGVQPDGPDSWKFDHIDTLLDSAEKAGVQILPILDYSISFANPAHKHLDKWEAYVRALVTRYHKRIPVWEVWNEQNIPGFWPDPSADDYFPLLKRTYETIKAIDPALTVAVGGYAGIPLDYIGRLYELGGGACFDIMNVHPYSQPAPPEESLEKRLTDLRALMAKHGDADKPVWITEIGWPTHKNASAAPGLIKAALTSLKPGKKSAWRVLVIDEPTLSRSVPTDAFLAPELPSNTRIQRVTVDALAPNLLHYDIDAVILPFDEAFPDGSAAEALFDYVRRGGTLIECGGMPFFYPASRATDGTWQRSQHDTAAFRNRLRIGTEAWWHDEARIPKKLTVRPDGPAKDVPAPKNGYTGERFLTPLNFKDGDRFIPLLTGKHGDYTGAAAAIFDYGSDLKGAVIVSALFEHGFRSSTETRQAHLAIRANLIAFQTGVQRTFWYEFQAPEFDDDDQESHFGIVHRDLSPKPAYHAYKALIAARPAGSTPLGLPWKSKSPDAALFHPHWQRPDGTPAGALWSDASPGLYKLTFSSPAATLTTHTGTPTGIRPAPDGTCVVAVTCAPLFFAGATLQSIAAADLDPATALHSLTPALFADAADQYRGLLKRLGGAKDRFPRRWENNTLVTVGPTEWTSGFFPGSLWLLHEYHGGDEWLAPARQYTAFLDQIRHFTGNHDIGFMLGCSHGNALRLDKTGDPAHHRAILLDGAAALCTRYNPHLGLIRSWNHYTYPVIIDNMMNLELLMWAAKQSGEERFRAVALSHADQTDAHHYRPDGSAFHIVDYNPHSRKILAYHAGQGASADAPWARGQSWGLYGFTMMFRETANPAYLARATSVADYLAGHPNFPADGIPYWDYAAAEIPHAPRDTSAAAIMASALIELSTLVADPVKAGRYRDTAVRQLLSLASPAYRAPVGDNGNFILMHGVGHLPGNSEIDVPLNYGDYYFLEALLRFRRLETK